MKISLSYLLILLLISACAKKSVSSDDEWPGMDSFHMIMAESYHPIKDSANLVPARANAEMMALEAEKWEEATLPDKVNNDEMKSQLAQLKLDARIFADQVKANASDSVLTASIEILHGEFHKITEAWHSGGGHEHP